MTQLDFGIFDWIDRANAPLHQLYEERLRLLEAADGAGFFAITLPNTMRRRWAGHPRLLCSSQRRPSARDRSGLGRSSICCRYTIRCG